MFFPVQNLPAIMRTLQTFILKAEATRTCLAGLIHSMNTPSELQVKLAQQTSTYGRAIAKTVGLGLAAGAAALYGQHSLSAARPIFPFIEQNFGLWQGAYLLTELVISVVWIAAMVQKTNRFQESLQQLRRQKIIDQQREALAQKNKARRIADLAEKRFVPKATRSSKFDY